MDSDLILEDAEKVPALKFDPPVLVHLAHGDEVFPEPLLRWDELAPGVRVGIKSPWEKFEFVCGVIQGVPGRLILVVGNSFGALEHVEGTGWVCTGLVPQENIMSELGQQKAQEAKDAQLSYTDKLLKRTKKGKSGSSK